MLLEGDTIVRFSRALIGLMALTILTQSLHKYMGTYALPMSIRAPFKICLELSVPV